MPHETFPIVAIGCSAGGLRPCQDILSRLPPDCGMALVVIQHLDRNLASHLAEVLKRQTSLPVHEAADGLEVAPNNVYVITPNVSLEITEGRLHTSARSADHSPHLSIDHFLRSLAKAVGSRAIAVILSGSGSDGALGVCEIKAAGGVTIVQEEASAEHSGMPHSAIRSGFVDFILPASEIASRLLALGEAPYMAAAAEPDVDESSYRDILAYIRKVTNVDFRLYRDATIKRRIRRRAMVFGHQRLDAYCELLKRDAGEVQALYHELLINVTSFFRDPELFETLKRTVFPMLMNVKPVDEPFRVWVAGCATGEEAYSIAIALTEFLDECATAPVIQIFATDLADDSIIDKARAGRYPQSIEGDVSSERLHRFFTKDGQSYCINKSIRDRCVFSQHNITADPPFSRVDLISCRNVLIYMSPVLQQRVLPLFQYGLRVPGYLILGPAESIGPISDHFDVVDDKWKVYSKKPVTALQPPMIPSNAPFGALTDRRRALRPASALTRVHDAAKRLLLSRYSLPAILVNDDFNVLEYHGPVADYLQIPAGTPTTRLLAMVAEGLFLELRSALAEAQSTNALVRRNVRVSAPGRARESHMEVLPISVPDSSDRAFLITFQDIVRADPTTGNVTRPLRTFVGRLLGRTPEATKTTIARYEAEIHRLRNELRATKEYMQSLIERQDSASNELRLAHEEVVSTNEEMSSTNEELETSREELQSTNEELTTVNEQLHRHNILLTTKNNDFNNLLESSDIALVMVGSDLRIRFFTPLAQQLMNLRAGDTDRPIGHIRPAISTETLDADIQHVISTGERHHKDVRGVDGRWYSLRIYPYRLEGNKVDGAAIVLVDIDELRKHEESLRLADQRKNEFLAMLGHELRNPLGPMTNALHLLGQPAADARQGERARAVLTRQVAQLTRIVDDLLDVTRVAQGKIELKREVVELVAIVTAAVETIQPALEVAGHRLVFEPCEDAIHVNADPLRVGQVLANLLNNAIKFSERSGEISIRCERVNDQAVITVRDNGAGIAPEVLPHIFELFVQEESFENHRRGGLGVGLTLVRKLVELHDGVVEARSGGKGQGSEFSVRLPLAQHQDSNFKAQTPSTLAAHTHARQRVLIIEDNIDQAHSLAMLLTLWGHEVAMAHEGRSGVAQALAFLPDVALVDLGLPDIDGYAVAKQMRQHPRLKHVRLVAQTGWGQAQDRARTKDAGFDHHLVKPVDPAQLAALVARHDTSRPH